MCHPLVCEPCCLGLVVWELLHVYSQFLGHDGPIITTKCVERAFPSLCCSILQPCELWLTERLPLQSWAQCPGLQPHCPEAPWPQRIPRGQLEGKDIIFPCACHSALLRGQWGFCEFSSERTGSLSGSAFHRRPGTVRTGAGLGKAGCIPGQG